MLGKLKQSERHSVSGPGSRRCRGRKGRSPRRVRPSNWAEAPEASLGRSGCAGGRARPGEEAPWGRLKGAERGSGCRAEGPRAVCGQVDGTRRAAVRGHRGAQGVGSCRETGARRSLAERQIRMRTPEGPQRMHTQKRPPGTPRGLLLWPELLAPWSRRALSLLHRAPSLKTPKDTLCC
ncbi:potassium voltage-gated channel subfamily E member 3 isoform X1 [Mustela lutreola]|uniref:potassium voltage-gated channel subfamily E member 3 isoform X1 n=1 Tax=Mustela lutreola TaxID=9666 RepID=UPI0027972DDF|nr:potassium voltage-gated channel subfamily E member 3 isoform X1 [Mustela lutreola]